MQMVFDTGKEGFDTILSPWQVEAMRYLWEMGKTGVTSRDVWLHVSEGMTISRASIIQFLNMMEKGGVVKKVPRPGKGGYHGVYTPKFDDKGFKLHIAKTIISKLAETFPDATEEAIEERLRASE